MKIPIFTSLTSDAITQPQSEKNLLAQSFINLLPMLNNPLQLITSAMNNNLTFQENINAEHQIAVVKSGVDFTVTLVKMKTRPTHMTVGYASGESIAGYCIKKYNSNSSIVCNITFLSGNTAGVNVDLMFY